MSYPPPPSDSNDDDPPRWGTPPSDAPVDPPSPYQPDTTGTGGFPPPPGGTGYGTPGYGSTPGYGPPPEYGTPPVPGSGFGMPAPPPFPGGYPGPGGFPGPGGYGGFAGNPVGPPPPNHLVWAILVTIFCCLPAGVVSIVYAAQVNNKYRAGDYAGAVAASRAAKNWAIVSMVIVALLVLIGLVSDMAGA